MLLLVALHFKYWLHPANLPFSPELSHERSSWLGAQSKHFRWQISYRSISGCVFATLLAIPEWMPNGRRQTSNPQTLASQMWHKVTPGKVFSWKHWLIWELSPISQPTLSQGPELNLTPNLGPVIDKRGGATLA